MSTELFERYKNNPILKPDDKFGAVFNCSAIKHRGKIHLLYRVIPKEFKKKKEGGGYTNYISSICHASSKDGINFKNRKIVLKPNREYDKFGCEDPRINLVENFFFVTYTALSSPAFSKGVMQIGLAITKDFEKFKKLGPISPKEFIDKNAVIFPEKVKGNFVMLHRIIPNIQIVYFKNFKQLQNKNFWKNYVKKIKKFTIMKPKFWWEKAKIGSSCQPIKTKYGWLLIYHGVDSKDTHKRTYRVGLALLDLKNPSKILARSPEPVFEPKEKYEVKGYTPRVVFPCGVVIKNQKLYLYYGAADKYCCLAFGNLNKILNYLIKFKC